jgi:hypothetical protein
LEYGTAKGRVDLHIPAVGWSIELVREGDGLEEHYGRFSKAGKYMKTMMVKDYIILDFCTSAVHKSFPRMCYLFLFIVLLLIKVFQILKSFIIFDLIRNFRNVQFWTIWGSKLNFQDFYED